METMHADGTSTKTLVVITAQHQYTSYQQTITVYNHINELLMTEFWSVNCAVVSAEMHRSAGVRGGCGPCLLFLALWQQ